MATASHELRTPLNAILGWTLTLRRGAHNPETDRALGIVERNARAQAKLIEDVLDVSRIVSGKLVLTLRPTTVSAAARAAIETVTPAADAKGIAVLAELEAEPALITARPGSLAAGDLEFAVQLREIHRERRASRPAHLPRGLRVCVMIKTAARAFAPSS